MSEVVPKAAAFAPLALVLLLASACSSIDDEAYLVNERAIADYGEVIRLDPRAVFAYDRRGKCWYAKKEFDKAIADFSIAYADQSERDHDVLMKAARSGRLEVFIEEDD